MTNAAAFRLYEGRTLSGSRAWGPNTGVGTLRDGRSQSNLLGRISFGGRSTRAFPEQGVFELLVDRGP